MLDYLTLQQASLPRPCMCKGRHRHVSQRVLRPHPPRTDRNRVTQISEADSRLKQNRMYKGDSRSPASPAKTRTRQPAHGTLDGESDITAGQARSPTSSTVLVLEEAARVQRFHAMRHTLRLIQRCSS